MILARTSLVLIFLRYTKRCQIYWYLSSQILYQKMFYMKYVCSRFQISAGFKLTRCWRQLPWVPNAFTCLPAPRVVCYFFYCQCIAAWCPFQNCCAPTKSWFDTCLSVRQLPFPTNSQPNTPKCPGSLCFWRKVKGVRFKKPTFYGSRTLPNWSRLRAWE